MVKIKYLSPFWNNTGSY